MLFDFLAIVLGRQGGCSSSRLHQGLERPAGGRAGRITASPGRIDYPSVKVLGPFLTAPFHIHAGPDDAVQPILYAVMPGTANAGMRSV